VDSGFWFANVVEGTSERSFNRTSTQRPRISSQHEILSHHHVSVDAYTIFDVPRAVNFISIRHSGEKWIVDELIEVPMNKLVLCGSIWLYYIHL
jgi:hypothetical protein